MCCSDDFSLDNHAHTANKISNILTHLGHSEPTRWRRPRLQFGIDRSVNRSPDNSPSISDFERKKSVVSLASPLIWSCVQSSWCVPLTIASVSASWQWSATSAWTRTSTSISSPTLDRRDSVRCKLSQGRELSFYRSSYRGWKGGLRVGDIERDAVCERVGAVQKSLQECDLRGWCEFVDLTVFDFLVTWILNEQYSILNYRWWVKAPSRKTTAFSATKWSSEWTILPLLVLQTVLKASTDTCVINFDPKTSIKPTTVIKKNEEALVSISSDKLFVSSRCLETELNMCLLEIRIFSIMVIQGYAST